MTPSPQHLSGFIDLLVEAVLRELETEQKNADAPGQGQRRQLDHYIANVQQETETTQTGS
jgi:hypothetical protein